MLFCDLRYSAAMGGKRTSGVPDPSTHFMMGWTPRGSTKGPLLSLPAVRLTLKRLQLMRQLDFTLAPRVCAGP
jgi:hypothetical protein